MRPAENVKRLIKNLQDTTSAQMDERVLGDVLRALEESKETSALKQPNIRRTIMKNPITKLAAAAMIIVGVGLGALLFRSSSQITWADVLEQMRNVKTVSYLLIKQSADASSDRPDSFRTIEEEYLTKDGWWATWMWEGLSSFTADQVKIVGTEQLDGEETILFTGPITVHVTDSGKSFSGECRVWVDSQSAIPLRWIVEYTDDKDIRHRTTFKDIQWNAE